MLLAGASEADVQQWLAERGIKLSVTSISEYYHRWVMPEHRERVNGLAHIIAQLNSNDLSPAILIAAKQRCLEVMAAPGGDKRVASELMRLILQAETTQQADRKLALLEAKAAAADAAREALQTRIAEGGLSPEALALAEEQLRLL